jgi:hypothetical protein
MSNGNGTLNLISRIAGDAIETEGANYTAWEFARRKFMSDFCA